MALQGSLGNIIIVDDDIAITDLLSLNLRSEGYNVTVKSSTDELDDSDIRQANLLIVDCSEHSPSGLEYVDKLKSTPAGLRTGVIYCATYRSDRTIVEALDAGADDSISKPFSLREMLARIRAVMRRYKVAVAAPESNVFTIDDMRIDMQRKTVMIDAEFVNLSNTEYSILELLVSNKNTYTSRIEIFRRVWPDGLGANERIVDTNISRLRRKLGRYGQCIVNRSGLGYMISA